MQTAPAPHDPIAAAWTAVRTILQIVTGLFGPPTALAALTLIPRAWRRDVVAWLRPAEALVRRLLLIRAAELAPRLKPAPKREIAAPWAFRPTDRATPLDKPAQWRGVRFVLIPNAARARRGAVARGAWPAALPKIVITPTTQALYGETPPQNPPLTDDRVAIANPSDPGPPAQPSRRVPPRPFTGLALGERLEALIRAVHRPEPLARRLARRLAQRSGAQPKPASALARMIRPFPDNAGNPARVALKELAMAVRKAGAYFSSA